MPTSSETRLKPGKWQQVIYVKGNNPETTTPSFTTTANRHVKTKTWLQTPGYLTKKKTGDLPMNNYSFQVIEEFYAAGVLVETNFNSVGTVLSKTTQSGEFGTSTFFGSNVNTVDRPTSGEKASVDAQASTKALLSLKGQKINALQAFAERGQTFRLIGDSITNIASAYGSLRKGNLPGAISALGGVKPTRKASREYKKLYPSDPEKAASNLWLQWSFGWRPLINDVYGAVEHYNQSITKDVVLKMSSSKVRSFKRVVKETTANSGWTSHHTSDRAWQYKCKYVVYYKLANDTTKTMAQLGLFNPATIAWELTPFSFVVDWLLPVGNFINSLDATVGLVFVKGCKTTCEKASVLKATSGKPASALKDVDMNVRSRYRLVAISRTTLTSFPSVAAPQWKNPLSKSHVLSALALLVQQFGKR